MMTNHGGYKNATIPLKDAFSLFTFLPFFQVIMLQNHNSAMKTPFIFEEDKEYKKSYSIKSRKYRKRFSNPEFVQKIEILLFLCFLDEFSPGFLSLGSEKRFQGLTIVCKQFFTQKYTIESF